MPPYTQGVDNSGGASSPDTMLLSEMDVAMSNLALGTKDTDMMEVGTDYDGGGY